jgi:hypothetical protein
VDHLAALTELTRPTYRNRDHQGVDAARAIAQLSRLRRLTLECLALSSDAQLAQVSTLSRLTLLSIDGDNLVAVDIPHCIVHTRLSATLWQPSMRTLLLRLSAAMRIVIRICSPLLSSLARSEHVMLPMQGAPSST